MKDWHRNIIIIFIFKTFATFQQYEQKITDYQLRKKFNLASAIVLFEDIDASNLSISCSYFSCLLLLLNYYIIVLGIQFLVILIFKNCQTIITVQLAFSSLILKIKVFLYSLLICQTLKCLHYFNFHYSLKFVGAGLKFQSLLRLIYFIDLDYS